MSRPGGKAESSYLEAAVEANLGKISKAMRFLRRWAHQRGLKPNETAYVRRGRDRQALRFSKSANPDIERAYRTHWVSPDLSERERERLAERQSRPPDLVRARPRVEGLETLQERFAGQIVDLFPGCPTARARAIARHAAARGSGRVGRSAAGRALQERAVELAVLASIRHEDTGYDDLLMAGVDRDDARERVRHDVDQVLHHWRQR